MDAREDMAGKLWEVWEYALKSTPEERPDARVPFESIEDAMAHAVEMVDKDEPYRVTVYFMGNRTPIPQNTYRRSRGWDLPVGFDISEGYANRREIVGRSMAQSRRGKCAAQVNPQGYFVIDVFPRTDDGRLNAVIFRPGQPQPYVYAFDYSPEDGTWSQGWYTSDLMDAYAKANPDIIESASITWTRGELRDAYADAGLPDPTKDDIDELVEAVEGMGEWREDALDAGHVKLYVAAERLVAHKAVSVVRHDEDYPVITYMYWKDADNPVWQWSVATDEVIYPGQTQSRIACGDEAFLNNAKAAMDDAVLAIREDIDAMSADPQGHPNTCFEFRDGKPYRTSTGQPAECGLPSLSRRQHEAAEKAAGILDLTPKSDMSRYTNYSR